MARLVYRNAVQAANGTIFVIAKDEAIISNPHAIIGCGPEGNVRACGGVGWDAIGGYEFDKAFFVFGERGQYAVFNESGLQSEGKIDEKDQYLILTGVNRVIDKFFVYGMGNALYRQVGAKKWLLYNDGIDEEHFGTQCVCASDTGALFCVGSDGEIYELVNEAWIQRQSPTNLLLTSCSKGVKGNVYICGEEGTLLEGKGDEWKELGHSFEAENFWAVIDYEDSHYVAGDTTVFEIDSKGELSPILGWYLPQHGIFASFLTVNDELWVIAEKGIFKLKNGAWVAPED